MNAGTTPFREHATFCANTTRRQALPESELEKPDRSA